MIKLKTYNSEYIDMCILRHCKHRQHLLDFDFKFKENRQYDEHIPHKTQKCKGIHFKNVQAEIMNIYTVHPADFNVNF